MGLGLYTSMWSLGDEGFALLDCFPELVLESFGGICVGAVEFFLIYEIVYFCFILFRGEDY
jgi:hypothetical protein